MATRASGGAMSLRRLSHFPGVGRSRDDEPKLARYSNGIIISHWLGSVDCMMTEYKHIARIENCCTDIFRVEGPAQFLICWIISFLIVDRLCLHSTMRSY